MYEPKLYSIYTKIGTPGVKTEWSGTHRLPISTALKMARELRDMGWRVVWRLTSEPGPSFKD